MLLQFTTSCNAIFLHVGSHHFIITEFLTQVLICLPDVISTCDASLLVEVSDGGPSLTSRIVSLDDTLFTQVDVAKGNIVIRRVSLDYSIPCWSLLSSSSSAGGGYPTDEHCLPGVNFGLDGRFEVTRGQLLGKGPMVVGVDGRS